MNHVLKYVHGVEPRDCEVPSVGTYWADRDTYMVVKVTRFEEATSEPLSQSIVHVQYLRSSLSFKLSLEKLQAGFICVSKPPSEKLFWWFRKFFDKRQIFSIRDVEKTPPDQLQHLYVMNGLSVASSFKQGADTKLRFPVPKLIIPMREKPDDDKASLVINVWESWVPVDLLEQYKPSTILDSKEFRRAVTRGHLYILSTEYARHLLAQPESHEEIRRMGEVDEFVKREIQRF